MSAASNTPTSELAALIATHYVAVGGDGHKDRDCHWAISERWSYGRHLVWFVEHDGYCYDALEDGEDGPFATPQEAEIAMAEHLRQAIEAIRKRE